MSVQVKSTDGRIHYVENSKVELYADVELIADDGPSYYSNRLLLASVSPFLHQIFIELEDKLQGFDSDFCIITEIDSINLESIVEFVNKGTISSIPDPTLLDIKTVDSFRQIGIDLSSKELNSVETHRETLTVFPDLSTFEGVKFEHAIKAEAIDPPDDIIDFDFDDIPIGNLKRKKVTKQKPGKSKRPKVETFDEVTLHLDNNSESETEYDQSAEQDFELGNKSLSKPPPRTVNRQLKIGPDDESKIIQCLYCTKKYFCRRAWYQHMFRHEADGEDKNYFCYQCGTDTAFKTRAEVAEHKKEFHRNKKFECPRCDKVFNGNFYHRFKLHVAEHDLPPKHVCETCGFATKTADSLKVHKFNSGPFHNGQCATCDEQFTSWADHERHVYKMHGDFQYRCGLCPKVFPTIHIQRVHRKEEHFKKVDTSVPSIAQKAEAPPKEDVVCQFCGKLVKANYYDKHLTNNHANGSHPCPKCGKIFNHPAVVERHIKNYHNEFPCEHCGKVMRNKKKHSIHILSKHTPDHLKPYQCTTCDPAKGFHTRNNLLQHMNVHSNERPHKCQYCGAGFNSQGNRYAHERANHQGIKRKK